MIDFTKQLLTPRLRIINDKLVLSRVPWAEKYEILIEELDIISDKPTDLKETKVIDLLTLPQIFNRTEYRYLKQLPLVSNYVIENGVGVQKTAKYLDYNENNPYNGAYTIVDGYSYGFLATNFGVDKTSSNGVGIGHISNVTFKPDLITSGYSQTINFNDNSIELENDDTRDKYKGNKIVSLDPLGNVDNIYQSTDFYAFIYKDMEILDVKDLYNCRISIKAITTKNIFGSVFLDSEYTNYVYHKSDKYRELENKSRVIFYKNKGEFNRLNKNDYLNFNMSLIGVFRDNIDILSPIFEIETNTIPKSNYCYIPDFDRYYYIDNITCINKNLYLLECSIDVLFSHINAIQLITGIIDRCSDSRYQNYNLLDSKLPTETIRHNKYINGTGSHLQFDVLDVNYCSTMSIFGLQPTNKKYNDEDSEENYFDLGNTYNNSLSNNPLLVCRLDHCYELFKEIIDNPKGFSELISRYFTNISDYVEFGRWFPFSIMNNIEDVNNVWTTKQIYLGTVPINFNIEMYLLKQQYIDVYGGSITINLDEISSDHNFVKYTSYVNVDLYIPFLGFIQLPSNVVVDSTLYLHYYVDIRTGETIVKLFKNVDGRNIIYTNKCNVAVDLGFGRSNVTERVQGLVNGTAKLAITAATGLSNISGATKSLQNLKSRATRRTTPKTKLGMKISDASSKLFNSKVGFVGDLVESTLDVASSLAEKFSIGATGGGLISCSYGENMIAHIYYPHINEPENYNLFLGRPSGKYAYVGDFRYGFVKFSEVHIEINDILGDEYDDIEDFLLQGILI